MLLKNDIVFNGKSPIKVYEIVSSNASSPIQEMQIWPEHKHEYMQIWYVTQGSYIIYIENGRYKLNEKSILVIPPLVSHRVEKGDENCKIIGCELPLFFILPDNQRNFYRGELVIQFAYIETFETAIRKTKPQYNPSIQCLALIEQLMLSMLKIYNKADKFYEIELKAKLLELLVAISRDFEITEKYENNNLEKYVEDIRRAEEYIIKNYNNKIYLNDVSKIANMSISYFSYFFKEITGKNFIKYVNHIRLEKAKDMLINTDMVLQDICDTVGFNDLAYFNRAFKRKENVSPGKYRKNYYKKV